MCYVVAIIVVPAYNNWELAGEIEKLYRTYFDLQLPTNHASTFG